MGGDGSDNDGGRLSLTVTVNVPVAVPPQAFDAVQVTVLVVIGKVLPEAGEQFTEGDGSPSSTAVTEYVTSAPEALVAGTVMSAGMVSTGVVALTSTPTLPSHAPARSLPDRAPAIRRQS